MSETKDPLEGLMEELTPSLSEQIAPYRTYGDTALALSLLRFQKVESVGVPSLSSGECGTFHVRSQPANAGFDYYCPECEENVRGVNRPGVSLCACPLCGEEPGMLTLGRGTL